MSTGTSKPKRSFRKCNNCFISGEQKKLFTCSRCRAQTYCSKECQKADWPKHKPACQNNGLLETLLKEHESSPLDLLDCLHLVDGVSLYELDQRLERWVRFHNSTLMGATIHALALPRAVARARTHVLHVTLAARPEAEHAGAPAKFFRVVDACVLALADAVRRPAPWPESLAQLGAMADEMERSGQGTVAAAMVECHPLAVQTVPFGSLTQRALKGEKEQKSWKSFLVQNVEQGLRPKVTRTRVGGGH